MYFLWKIQCIYFLFFPDPSVFLRYCCPECDHQYPSLEQFSEHALENHFPQANSLFSDKINRSTEEQQEILNVIENLDFFSDEEANDAFQDCADLTEKNKVLKKKTAKKRKSEQKFEELATSVVGSGFKKSKTGFHEILFYEKLQKYMEGEIEIPPKLEPMPWLNEDGTPKTTRIQK